MFSIQAPIVQDDPNMKIIIFESLQLRLSLIGGMFDTIVVSLAEQRRSFSTLFSLCLAQSQRGHGMDFCFLSIDRLRCDRHEKQLRPAEYCARYVGCPHPWHCSRRWTDRSESTLHDLSTKDSKRYRRTTVGSLGRSETILTAAKTIAGHLCCGTVRWCQQSNVESRNEETWFTSGSKSKPHSIGEQSHILTVLFLLQEKINSWELIEGSKSVTSICYSWFCAKKTERKRLRYEEQYRLLLRHKHSLFEKSLAYFRVCHRSIFTVFFSFFDRFLRIHHIFRLRHKNIPIWKSSMILARPWTSIRCRPVQVSTLPSHRAMWIPAIWVDRCLSSHKWLTLLVNQTPDI